MGITYVDISSRTVDERSAVLSAIAEKIVDPHPENREQPECIGLLIFDADCMGAAAAIHKLRRQGGGRILALSIAPEPPSAQDQWQLIGAGAADVCHWPADRCHAEQVAAVLQRWQAIENILASDLVRCNLVGTSPAWRAALSQLVEAACFSDASILVTGESGTGKELAARLIHTLDTRPDKRDIITVDCTTLVAELIGSELFGHERGAYTGATGPRDGAFALAHKGSLFLDEIGELPPTLQTQLLRVIQEKTYKRVGGNPWHTSDFRLICATNRDLQAEVAAQGFRADLYYRIATQVIHLPPLRERTHDILNLARHFMAERFPAGEVPELGEPVRSYLLSRNYPGNVRELRQLVARLCARHVGRGPLSIGDIPADERPAAGRPASDWHDAEFERCIHRAVCLGVSLKEVGREASDTAIRLVIDEEHGNLQRAARRLGVTDRALQIRRANGNAP
jgi:transcriptional regulator with GAF, ATPase, and Fis domain